MFATHWMLVADAPVICILNPPLLVSAAKVGVPQAGVFWTNITLPINKVVAAALAPLTSSPSMSQAATFVVAVCLAIIVPLNL